MLSKPSNSVARWGLLACARGLGRWLCAAPHSLALALCAAWYGLIWLSSSRAGSDEPSSDALQVLSNSAHAPLFGLWAAWMALLAPRVGGWPALKGSARTAILGCVALGGLVDETHQALWSIGRDFSLLDIGTDLVGAWLALRLVEYLARPEATAAGWRVALLFAAVGSFAAGALATFVPRCFPGVGWL